MDRISGLGFTELHVHVLYLVYTDVLVLVLVFVVCVKSTGYLVVLL